MNVPHENNNSKAMPPRCGEDRMSIWTSTEVDFVKTILQECCLCVTSEEVFAQSKYCWHMEFSQKATYFKCNRRSGHDSSELCTSVLNNWAENGIIESMLEFVWESYICCTWLELRKVLGVVLIEGAKMVIPETGISIFSTINKRKVLEQMILDVDPSICTAAVQVYLQTESSANDMQLLKTIGHLLTHRKSKKVRYAACLALIRALDTTPGLDRRLALVLGSKLLKMSQLDPSILSRVAALKAVNKLFAVDVFPLSITDIANLVSPDDHPALIREWAQLMWSVVMLGMTAESSTSLLDRMLEIVRLVKTETLSEHQGAIILAHQETTWQSCCAFLQKDLMGHSCFSDALRLLVAWTELLTNSPKYLKVTKKRQSRIEGVEEIDSVVALLDKLQSEEMLADGVRLLCNVIIQGKYKEFEAIERGFDRIMDIFMSTSTQLLICVIGDFLQSLYEDPYYQARIKPKLDIIAALILSSKDEFYIYRFTALCGTVLKPNRELGRMEPDSIARFIHRQVEIGMTIDQDTISYLNRIIQLCPMFPDKLILILKTVGKYVSRAKVYQWPLPELPKEFGPWLIEYLRTSKDADTETIIKCILGLWYYNAVPDELIASVRPLLAEQAETSREFELVEP